MKVPTLKPGRQTYRFDQIAINVNDRVEPGDTDLEYYIGLEHLDSDSLKIRRWGTPDDVEATKLRFKKGDIIFGRRRVYQRKLAVADFDGICSAHAMVLRAKPDVVLPEFLPFFMQSDLFMNRALEISVGSLSPTINWKTLAAQEFPLPPPDEQRRLVEVLRAIQIYVAQLETALSSIRVCEIAYLDSTTERLRHTERSVALGELLTGSPQSGCSIAPRDTPTGHWVLALSALSRLGYIEGELKPVDRTVGMIDALLVNGDLLISRSNTRDRVGYAGIYNGEREGLVSFPDTMMRMTANTDLVSNEFLEFLLQSPLIRREVMSIAAGTSASMKKINRRTLLALQLPLPSLPDQAIALDRRRLLKCQIERVKKRLEGAKNLRSLTFSSMLT
ncbi:MAG: restriction endonuclease subunit S [Candidatus Promineofilum sp.]|nr:restriction endonuclease subunit S [Promineifilum sp.]MCW5861551.1 restriction endonuclease subunit S [Anaerolineae bacterium]